MFKIGDKVINNKRSDDKLPNGNGTGIVIHSDNNEHYYIKWDIVLPYGVDGQWVHKSVLELDIQQMRNDALDRILS